MSSPVSSASRLLLVDGHAYAYRSFHAIRSLTSPNGQPTNGIFGFVNAIRGLCSSLGPTHLAVVWDGGLDPERMKLVPEYKAQRPPMPASLEAQLDDMARWVATFGGASLCWPGVEADDAIATLAMQTAAEHVHVVVASSDKDFLQLVSPQIGIVNPADRTARIWTQDDVVEKAGVRPDQVVDWLSLVGDTVDNIDGIPGVGKKTAAALLQRFGTCEAILQRVEEVGPDRIRDNLTAGADVLRRNREVIRLKTNLELQVQLDQMRRRPADRPQLAELYRRWGFRSLLREVDPVDPHQATLGF